MQFQFDDEFQFGVFELMMIDTSFCGRAVAVIQPTYFKNEYYAYFFNRISYLFESYGLIPNKMQLTNEILNLPLESQKLYLRILDRIFEPKTQYNHAYIRDNLKKFCLKASNMHIYETIKRHNNSDPDDVSQMLNGFFEDQKNIDFDSVPCQTIENMDVVLEKSKIESAGLISVGLPAIDKALGGGVPRGTLTIALSTTNGGKSIWLVNLAYHLIYNLGLKVFVVTLEGHENQMMVRLVSRATGAPMGKVRWNDFTEKELERKKDFMEKTKGKLQHFFNSSFEFKIENLIPILRAKKEEFDYDVLLIDYVQILKSKRKYENKRTQQAEVHRQISDICSSLNVAGFTVAQGTRDVQVKNQEGRGLIRMSDVSECFEIMRAAATCFTLNRSDEDIRMHIARILLEKQREGKVGIIEVCKTNFDRMAYYGTMEEGLGFISMEQYIKQSLNKGAVTVVPDATTQTPKPLVTAPLIAGPPPEINPIDVSQILKIQEQMNEIQQ